MIWADEIFQTLEQGHRLAFGYGLVPWEFQTGARSWLLAGLIGGLMKALAFLGVKSGAGLAIGLKLGFALLSTLAFWPLLRMANAAAGLTGTLLLGLLATAFPPSLIYSSRALAEVACVPCLTWGLWLLSPWGMGTVGRAAWRAGRLATTPWWKLAGRPLVAGALLGFSAVLRYQNGVLLPVIFFVVLGRRGLLAALFVTLGAALVGVLGGLLDWATWGRPFKSLTEYVRFNLIESGANQWGVRGRGYYLDTLWATAGPLLLVAGLGAVAGLRRSWPIALLVFAFVAVHSAIPHKELRFLFPVLPLFLLCSAVGLGWLLDRIPFPRRTQIAAASAAGLAMLALWGAQARAVTFTHIGQVMASPANGGPTSPLVWRAFDERNRLLSQAGTHADLCGLAAPSMNAYWTGAYTYFHRRAPILWSGGPGDYAAANYVILSPGQKMADPRFQSIATRGGYQLYRRDGTCAPAPRPSVGYGRLTLAGVSGP